MEATFTTFLLINLGQIIKIVSCNSIATDPSKTEAVGAIAPQWCLGPGGVKPKAFEALKRSLTVWPWLTQNCLISAMFMQAEKVREVSFIRTKEGVWHLDADQQKEIINVIIFLF